MQKLINLFNNIINLGRIVQVNIGALALLGMIVTISLGIVSRYVFNTPFLWTEELGIFLFIWLSFMGASVAAATNKHVAIRLLTNKLSLRNVVYLKIITILFTLVFLAIMVFGAVKLQPQTVNHASIVLGIPKNLYYLPLLITGIYMIVVLIRDLISYTFNIDYPGRELQPKQEPSL